jgi:Ca2+-binding RTX toxin-like protein
VNIFGTSGTDWLYGSADSDLICGLDGNDYLYGGEGDDLLIGGAGPDVLFGGTAYTRGGADRDMAAYWDSWEGVYVDLSWGRGFGGSAEGDTLIDIESLRGSEHGDQLAGNGLANDLDGGGGNDWLVGAGGNDDLVGGFGDDMLDGGSGADILDGGPGSDTAHYGWSPGGVWASLAYGGFTGDAAGDSFASIENLTGSGFTDFLQGDDGDNRLSGLGGDDWLWAEGGNDTLEGGTGIDALFGGAGADTFLWTSIAETGAVIAAADLIGDFDSAFDRIDVQAIDADETLGGDQAFAFIGGGAFTAAGQIGWALEGSDTVIRMNTGGDLAADAVIRIAGVHALGAGAFLL